MIKAAKKLLGYVFGGSLGGETVRYVIIGGMTTLVNLGLFELLHRVLSVDVTVSNVTSIITSIIFAYFANKLVVFRWHCDTKKELALEFIKFVGSRAFTFFLEVGAVYLFHNILGFDATLVKVAATVIVVILNYLISKIIVFRKAKE